MKKITCVIVSLMLLLSLTSCSIFSSISSIVDLFSNMDKTLPIALEDAKAMMEEKANQDGVEITFVFDDGEKRTECTIGKKGTTQWKYILQDGTFNGYIAETSVNGARISVTTESKTSGWAFSETITSEENMPDYFEENSDLLYYGHAYPVALFTEDGTEVINERSCTHYVFQLGESVEGLSSLFSLLGSSDDEEASEEDGAEDLANLQLEFWYDTELGLTMKAIVEGTDSETSEGGNLYFEITSISFAPEVPKGK